MTNDTTSIREDRICICSGTTTAQIKTLIDQGMTDLDSISRATGACSGCGACDFDVLALIKEYSPSNKAEAL
jgi:bacterioferritin-associated ferredoxin